MTTADGVFAAGDMVPGSKTVVNAASQSQDSCRGNFQIFRGLRSKDVIILDKENQGNIIWHKRRREE